MNVLSLFNGMSVCQMAMEDCGIEMGAHYISEIDKYANKASFELFPNQIQLGDVTQWRDWDVDWSSIDLVTGGFPCQAWSLAGKQLGDKDERGMLFWTMLDIMKHVKHHNPKAHFLIENVKMKKEFEQYITTHTENALGNVHKILINSALVSAQNRNRYYWTSFPVTQPEDEGILLKDVIETNGEYTYMSDKFVKRQQGRKCLRDDLNGKAVNLSAMEYVKNGRQGDYINTRPCQLRETQPTQSALCHHVATATDIRGNESIKRVYAETGKAPTLTTMGGGHREPKVLVTSAGRNSKGKRVLREISSEKTPTLTARYYKGVQSDGAPFIYSGEKNKGDEFDYKNDAPKYRKLTPRECMRLQTIPEHHIDTLLSAGISNSQLYKMTGNAWNMKTISHILKCMMETNKES